VTVLDDRAEALAGQLHNASVAAAQLADARDQAQAEPNSAGYLMGGQFAARDFDAEEPAAEHRRTGAATDARTSHG
jgi:hypothetical protein